MASSTWASSKWKRTRASRETEPPTSLQIAISFVAGLMLGIALLHFLPDAAEQLHSLDRTVAWMLGSARAMIHFRKAALVRIDVETLGAEPKGVLKWMLTAGIS